MTYEPAELPQHPHVDQVDLVVRQLSYPSEPAEEGYHCSWWDFNVSLDEASRAATAVAWNQTTGSYEPFAMDQRLSRFSWGADGTALTFVIDLARDVSSDVIVAGIGYAIGRMRGTPKRQPEDNAVDLSAASTTTALTAVAVVFAEAEDDLSLVSATLVRGVLRAEVQGSRGRYFATVAVLDSGDLLTHVKRV